MEMERKRVSVDPREHMRLRCDVQVVVETIDHRLITGRLRDIGINSLYLFTNQEDDNFLIEGEKVSVSVHMHRGENRLTIDMGATVVRLDATGFAVKFKDLLRWWPIFAMYPA